MTVADQMPRPEEVLFEPVYGVFPYRGKSAEYNADDAAGGRLYLHAVDAANACWAWNLQDDINYVVAKLYLPTGKGPPHGEDNQKGP